MKQEKRTNKAKNKKLEQQKKTNEKKIIIANR